MNNTNRAANRIVLLIVGLVLLCAGAAAALALAWPAAASVWTNTADTVDAWLTDMADRTQLADGSPWNAVSLGGLAVLLVLVVLLITVVARLGGSRSRTVFRGSGDANERGRITITESFVSDAVSASLSDRDEILTTHVTANDVRKQPVLHVSVTPRQNTNPRELADRVNGLLTNLATLTGENTPTYVSIHTSLRARLAHDQRRLS